MKAFDYFLELTKIPRGSFNEKKVSDYICNKAKSFNLSYKVDNLYNVKVFKNNNSKESIILQAHLDMVCEKNANYLFDFMEDSIKTKIEGDYISTYGTTLGADDGFGVALILEMLENCGEGFPNIEAVFTTQEEVGMGGVKNLDCKDLKGRYMIGLDGTSSNQIIVSCAGSVRMQFLYKRVKKLDSYDKKSYKTFKIKINNLLGGHSGEDINKNRINANKIVFEFLSILNKINSIKICEVKSASKLNAIPRECEIIYKTNIDGVKINELLYNFKSEILEKYKNEENMEFDNEEINEYENDLELSFGETLNLIDFINNFTNGVLETEGNENSQVIASINLANIMIGEDCIEVNAMYRFNKADYEKTVNLYKKYAKNYGFIYKELDFATNFNNSKNQELQKKCADAYYECGYKNLDIVQIHAGLEGGFFVEKMKDIQLVVLGADLYNFHTPNEMMRISSLDKLAKWLRCIMRKINK